MSPDRTTVAAKREDLSRFIVHLTRDDRKDFPRGGATARSNFITIYEEKAIRPFQAHCLHMHKLKTLPSKIREAFDVVCFSEVPLNQVHLLTQPILGRRIELQPYGFVFRKTFLIEKGAQPALYINGYGENTALHEAVDAILERAIKDDFKKPMWRILPFVNAMHERYDFTWEREWRLAGTLHFDNRDLVCVILPESSEQKLKQRMAKAGIAVMSPGWLYEQIVSELARQQRRTRKLLREAKEKQ